MRRANQVAEVPLPRAKELASDGRLPVDLLVAAPGGTAVAQHAHEIRYELLPARPMRAPLDVRAVRDGE